MKTCKDCIHYGICRLDVYFIHANNGDTYQCQDSDKVEEDCEAFTDKSEWVHLPCKVGDIVYQVDSERIYEMKVRAVIYDTDGIAFDERAIGKSVFLTRAEAEKALEERKEK